MVYGILASRSCLLTDISDQLHETVHKANTVKRLSNHLSEGTPASAAASYLHTVKRLVPSEPVVLIDESDIVKPDGKQFEALGIVRDGSESTQTKSVYKKGYHVTEACVLTASKHPVSVFSMIHSSVEKDCKSVSTITFDAVKQAAALFGKATFVMDRGYDDKKMFLILDKLKQDYVIRIARTYFSRWWIEEYFRCKKQTYQLENFRVRKLEAINALNFYITLAQEELSPETNTLKVSIIQEAAPIKEKGSFCYYRLAKGISGILSYAKEGIQLWYRTKRPAYRQLCLKLTV